MIATSDHPLSWPPFSPLPLPHSHVAAVASGSSYALLPPLQLAATLYCRLPFSLCHYHIVALLLLPPAPPCPATSFANCDHPLPLLPNSIIIAPHDLSHRAATSVEPPSYMLIVVR
ncbi:hypothetical protein B296_00018356 [Ensete ventricosum]|uniref:Uncharacterized protein n=1 Tax=Ensete ventricosum TaxID=4639 RepID=A0A426YX50_ENSVE|nr:hypothetical protein B296_00018356 [Ensete ventricosum]